MKGQRRTRSALVIVAVVLITGWIAACTRREQPAPNVKPTTPDTFVQWYQNCWTDFNEHRLQDFKQCYAPNATSQQPGYGKPSATGPDDIVKASEDFIKTFPDGRGEGELILVNGNHLTSIYLLKGTNTGPLFAPDGKELPGRNQRIGLFFGHSIDIDPAAGVVKEIGVLDGITLENQMGLLKRAGRPLTEAGVPSPVVLIAKNDETETKNVEAANAQLAAWNKHDGAAVDSFKSDDYILHDLTQPADLNKMQTAEMDKAYWKAFSDSKIDVTNSWGAGGYVSVTGTFDGTNDSDFVPLKMKRTGKKVHLPFIDIFRLDAGKIKEEWLFFDSASLLTQLSTQ